MGSDLAFLVLFLHLSSLHCGTPLFLLVNYATCRAGLELPCCGTVVCRVCLLVDPHKVSICLLLDAVISSSIRCHRSAEVFIRERSSICMSVKTRLLFQWGESECQRTLCLFVLSTLRLWFGIWHSCILEEYKHVKLVTLLTVE